MKLNQFESESAMWKKVEGEIKERLQVLREKNDGAHNELETAGIRGAIRLCKEILSWGIQEPKMPE